jgi:hypothetical protein
MAAACAHLDQISIMRPAEVASRQVKPGETWGRRYEDELVFGVGFE